MFCGLICETGKEAELKIGVRQITFESNTVLLKVPVLLKIAAGLVEADSGAPIMQSGTTSRYLPQEPDLSGHATTLDYVQAGLTEGDENYRALYLLNELGRDGTEHPANPSGGEARRAAPARALAPEPDLLLLDEPTAGMSASARTQIIERVAQIAKEQHMTVLFTEHDMDAVFGYATRILVMDQGCLIADGTPEGIRQNSLVQSVYLGDEYMSDA